MYMAGKMFLSGYIFGKDCMKWRDKIIISLLLLFIISLSANIYRNLWTVHKEQQLFASLKNHVEKVKKEIETLDNSNVVNGTEMGMDKVGQNVLPEYEGLLSENADFVGWIFIEGTKIDYPVVQSLGEPEYYLHRNFKGEKSYSGTPFVGSGSLKEETGAVFLYGHHMRNGTMFADLLNYREKSFWEYHPTIFLDTLYEHRQYQIFTAFYAKETDWIQEDGLLFAAVNSGKIIGAKDLETLASAGLYDTGIIPETGTSLLFLVTCSYQEADGRFVVIGSRVP